MTDDVTTEKAEAQRTLLSAVPKLAELVPLARQDFRLYATPSGDVHALDDMPGQVPSSAVCGESVYPPEQWTPVAETAIDGSGVDVCDDCAALLIGDDEEEDVAQAEAQVALPIHPWGRHCRICASASEAAKRPGEAATFLSADPGPQELAELVQHSCGGHRHQAVSAAKSHAAAAVERLTASWLDDVPEAEADELEEVEHAVTLVLRVRLEVE